MYLHNPNKNFYICVLTEELKYNEKIFKYNIYTDNCLANTSSAYLRLKKFMFFCEKSMGSPAVIYSIPLSTNTPQSPLQIQ